MELPDPPLFGRPPFEHEVLQRPSGVSADDMLHGWNTQSSSQWDGFRHVRNPVHGAYGGIPEGDHGIHVWARKGIVGRGVVVDVARWRASVGRPITANETDLITPGDLLSTIRAQNIEIVPGDILLMRTGWLEWYRTLGADARARYAVEPAHCGLEPTEAMAGCLWDLHVSCLGADNPAIEAWPPPMYAMAPEERAARLAEAGDPAVAAGLFLHLVLLPLLGLPLGEMFDLDALAADCAAAGSWDCLVTSAPLNLLHGVATPPNVIAVR
jgi:kynurenine formamidase